jgi:hypothetical protein
LTENSFEEIWSDNLRISSPHFSNELSPCLHDSTLCSQWIFPFSIYKWLIFSIQVVLSQLICVRKTLYTTIHITRISKISQSN